MLTRIPRNGRRAGLRFVALVGLVGVGAVGVQIADGNDSDSTPTQFLRQPLVSTSVPTAGRDLVASFAVFRRDAFSSDVPEGLAAHAAGTGATTVHGASLGLARQVGNGPLAGSLVYAVPGDEALCEVLNQGADGAGMTCAPAGLATDEGVSMTSGTGPTSSDRMVFGIAPDWATSVTFTSPDGTQVKTAIVRNGYAARVPAQTRDGELSNGKRTLAIHIVNP